MKEEDGPHGVRSMKPVSLLNFRTLGILDVYASIWSQESAHLCRSFRAAAELYPNWGKLDIARAFVYIRNEYIPLLGPLWARL